MIPAVDLFAGARGWGVGAVALGINTTGIEIDRNANSTACAAGFNTIEADVRECSPREHPLAVGLIASPPCQTFAVSGLKSAHGEYEAVRVALGELVTGGRLNYTGFADERTGLVLEPLRWAIDAFNTGKPFPWIVLEQVTQVLPVWQWYATPLRVMGYSVATGNLDAEAYGVPQTRRRAFLVARLNGPAVLPTPTHSRFHRRDPYRLDPGMRKWVSMTDAMGWNPFNLVGFPRRADRHDRITIGDQTYRSRDLRRAALPSWSITGKARSWSRFINSGSTLRVRVSLEETAQLQTFPADYPFAGFRTDQFQQVANAIPPVLARAVLSAALGIPYVTEEVAA